MPSIREHVVKTARRGAIRAKTGTHGMGLLARGPGHLTIRPVPYPGRTPHIHFAVSGPGFPRFITQMYAAGEPQNERDGVLMSVRDPRRPHPADRAAATGDRAG